MNPDRRPIQVLLVEDNLADVALAREALEHATVKTQVHHVVDGVEALDFLRRQGQHAPAPAPDLILLDLNLPRMDGRTLLAEIKRDPTLRRTPVIVLTSSRNESDILSSYDLQASCYLVKPRDVDQFKAMASALETFWLSLVALPRP